MKSKIVAGVLAFFAGGLGVHRFYLGEVGKGILYIIFCWTFIPFLIAFIDGIVFLTMDDDAFNEKYNKDYVKNQRDRYRRYEDREERYERRESRQFQREEQRQYRPEYQRENRPPVRPKTNPFKNEGTRLYREYDFKGAIEQYRKSLEVEARDPQINFNLACLYSLMEDRDHSYLHLSKAIEQGYNDFERIRSHDHLAFLRTDDNFENFVKSGYKLGVIPKEEERKEEETPQLNAPQNDMLELDENVIERLKMLAELRDKGILTEEEFQKQKEIMTRK